MSIWRRNQIYDLYEWLLKNDCINTVLTGGYFNPLTPAHIKLLQTSSDYGTLIVAVNDDHCSIKKSGYSFMPVSDRLEIINGIKGVEACVENTSMDMVDIIRILQPQIYTKGGGINANNISQAEKLQCELVNCEIVYDVGGAEKVSSSSRFLGNYANWVTTLRDEGYNIEENYI